VPTIPSGRRARPVLIITVAVVAVIAWQSPASWCSAAVSPSAPPPRARWTPARTANSRCRCARRTRVRRGEAW